MRTRSIVTMVLAGLLIMIVAVQIVSGQTLPIWDHPGNLLPPPNDPAYNAYGTPGPIHDVVCSDTDLSNAAEEPSCPPPVPHGTPVRGSDTTGEESGPPSSSPGSTLITTTPIP
jgi:hypothetical protein